MAKQNQVHHLPGETVVISELEATGFALMMRQNAEALFVDLAGHNGAFNPDRPRRRRRPASSSS
jgi:hypothetical protein